MEEQEEQLYHSGEEAEFILNHNAFSSTINSLVDASFATFTNTKPGELEQREAAYHNYRALIDIVSTLQQRVQVKNEIMMKHEDDNNQKGDA